MTDAATKAIGFAKGRSREDLDQDELLRFALTKLVEIVGAGAAAKHVSSETRLTSPTWHGPPPHTCGIGSSTIISTSTLTYSGQPLQKTCRRCSGR